MTNGPSKEFVKRLNARKIDFWLDSDAQPVASLADRIYSQLMKKRVWINRREPEKRLRHLRMLLLNLYAAASADPARYVSLSLNKNDYSLHTRYEPQFRSYEIVDRLIEGLGADCLGYVEKETGWQDSATGKGYWTRIRATRALQKLFAEFDLHPWMISKLSDAEAIRLKDSNKNLIEYRDDENTNRMRINIQTLNERLSKTFIGLHIPDTTLCELLTNHGSFVESWDDADRPVDWADCRLYRVFNDSVFENGGRFFGGWWQRIPSNIRRHIYICHPGNTYPTYTTEFDYSSIQPTIAYARRSIDPPPDAYRIDGLSEIENEQARDILKKAMLRMFNTVSFVAAVESTFKYVEKERLDFSKDDISQLVRDLERQHLAISDMFYKKETGKKLMREESNIAEWVMLDMLRKGAMALPIHDSFLVTKGYRDYLRNSMTDAFREIFGVDCSIKADLTEPQAEWGKHGEGLRKLNPHEDGLWEEFATHSIFWKGFRSWLEDQEQHKKQRISS